jgi:hypothetical protein
MHVMLSSCVMAPGTEPSPMKPDATNKLSTTKGRGDGVSVLPDPPAPPTPVDPPVPAVVLSVVLPDVVEPAVVAPLVVVPPVVEPPPAPVFVLAGASSEQACIQPAIATTATKLGRFMKRITALFSVPAMFGNRVLIGKSTRSDRRASIR